MQTTTQDARYISQNRSGGMRYARLFALGSGGMASVHLALAVGPSGFNRLVVVKQMHQELLARDETYQMFLAEARLSARLNHPNVVQVSEVVEGPDGVMLVMEYLDGMPLSAMYRVANEPFTLPMRLRLICEVLAGLHYAHELTDYQGRPLGIVHRDVSPQNVFVTYDGRIKLLDFGIAKATNSHDQTRSGMIKGRMAYMPAEQLTGTKVDRRTDVYTVGCLLWEAIAGSRLWANQSDRDIARNVVMGNLPRLSSRVNVDPDLEAITARAMARDPAQRFATAEEMRLELESYLSRNGIAVSVRDIGTMLDQNFSEVREHRQRSIAQAIAELDLSQMLDAEMTPPVESSSFERPVPRFVAGGATSRSGEHRLLGTLTGTDSWSSLRGEALEPAARSSRGTPPPAPRQRSALWPVVALATLVGAGALVGAREMGLLPRAELAAKATRPVVPTPAANATHTLSVEVTPADARVLVDGRLVPGNPAVITVPANSEHVVRIEREGWSPVERLVKSSQNLALAIELPERASVEAAETEKRDEPVVRSTPVPTAVQAVVAKPAAVTKPAAAVKPAVVAKPEVTPPPAPKPEAPTSGAVDCNPPYYFENGIKNYKPGCI